MLVVGGVRLGEHVAVLVAWGVGFSCGGHGRRVCAVFLPKILFRARSGVSLFGGRLCGCALKNAWGAALGSIRPAWLAFFIGTCIVLRVRGHTVRKPDYKRGVKHPGFPD